LTLWPGLDAAFVEVVQPHIAGDPMRAGVLWTNLSLRRLAKELARRGYRVSVKVVIQLLAKHRLGRRKALKKRAHKHHPQRDRQFHIITQYRKLYEAAGNPIISFDTKKKELIGNIHRNGHIYTQTVFETLDHDFPSLASGVIYPHGLYDLQRNHGHLNIGTSHDTSQFACDSIAFWWDTFGRKHYPHATSVLLLCDGGGSNAANRYVFKFGLEQLAQRLGVELRVSHYPPYESKYNPIEHRFFPHVTRACAGVIFHAVETALEKLAQASTTKGLTTTVHLLKGDYPTGDRAPKGYKKTMRIQFDDDLPRWNYRAVPLKQGS
jgi:hypothetical protein